MPTSTVPPKFGVQFETEQDSINKLKIQIIGVGGGGGSIVADCAHSNLNGVELWATNTDSQALENLRDQLDINVLSLGKERNEGAGGDPEVGHRVAIETQYEILSILDHTRLLFVVACMGGGTGTGAAPVIARCAKERGIMTVGVVTRPRTLEQRSKKADEGIHEMRKHCHALMVIPNDNAFLHGEDLEWKKAVGNINQRLVESIRAITDMLFKTGTINRDFKDFETSLRTDDAEAFDLFIGTAQAGGEDRKEAIKAQLLDVSLHDISLSEMANAQIICFTTNGKDGNGLRDSELRDITSYVQGTGDHDTELFIGLYEDESIPDGELRASLIMPIRRATAPAVDPFGSGKPNFEVVDDDEGWDEMVSDLLDSKIQNLV